MEKATLRAVVSGAATGAINGLLGGGGGMVLVPLLCRWQKLDERKAFATAVAVILPLCMLSSVIYLFRGQLDLAAALPYLLGGAVGGLLSGRLFQKVNMLWLRRGFALLILFAGAKAAFFAG